MAVILRELGKLNTFLNEDLADPRTKHFFFVDTIWRVPFLIAFYVYFVNVLGPKFMEKRQPYKLDRIIQIYNVLQIIFNLYIFYLAMTLAWFNGYNLRCEPVDYSYTSISIEITGATWYYFVLKIMDLLDTIFFILRKKQTHVSFLHVYHHSGMVLITWTGVKYLPGGQSILLGTINTIIHSIMYTHYLLASMKINTKLWKKHITQLQIIQFFILFWHFSQLLWIDCGFPKWTAFIMIPQYVFMLVLFIEFYYNAYIHQNPTSSPTSTKMGQNNVSAEIASNGKLKEQ